MLGSQSRGPEEGDIFVLHTLEDRDVVARPLATDLRGRGWKVWFDEFKFVGKEDTFYTQIDASLRTTRAGIVILSPSFFAKRRARNELEILIAREIEASTTVILPVWHRVDAVHVARASPRLGDRLAVSTESGLMTVADQIDRALRHHLALVQPGKAATAIDAAGMPLELGSPERSAFDLTIAEFNDELIAHLTEMPQRLYELSPRRFEELVAALYEKAGFEVKLTPASGDGGVDVYAIRRHGLGSTLTVVQAKRYKPGLKVTAAHVRELYGTVNLRDASAGVLITTSSFEAGAEKLAAEHRWRLDLHDYARLQEIMRTMRGIT